jgi:microcystin-dependent protein
MPPFIGEIRMFAGSFAPVGWAFCDGQLQPISENDALFTLIGTTYGGDGQETFALPDLRGRSPVHQGGGHVIGEVFGVETVTLNVQQIPSHTHPFLASTAAGSTANAHDKVLAVPSDMRMYIRDAPGATFPATTVSFVGGSQPHENRHPVLAVSYIISLFGVFPHQ